MWQVICIGPGFNDHPRRVTDRGPLMADQQRAEAIAAWLRATGLYEHVRVVDATGAITSGEGSGLPAAAPLD